MRGPTHALCATRAPDPQSKEGDRDHAPPSIIRAQLQVGEVRLPVQTCSTAFQWCRSHLIGDAERTHVPAIQFWKCHFLRTRHRYDNIYTNELSS